MSKLSIAEFTERLESLTANRYVAVEGHTMTLDLAKFLRSKAGEKSLNKITATPQATPESRDEEDETA